MCPDNALHTGNAWTGSYRTEALAKQRKMFAEEDKDSVFAVFLYFASAERMSNHVDRELKTVVPVECSENNL